MIQAARQVVGVPSCTEERWLDVGNRKKVGGDSVGTLEEASVEEFINQGKLKEVGVEDSKYNTSEEVAEGDSVKTVQAEKAEGIGFLVDRGLLFAFSPSYPNCPLLRRT